MFIYSLLKLSAWYKAVIALENQVIADYLQLILLTGLRRNEAAQLKWSDIDFKANTLTISDPKNHQDHILPITNHINDILQRRLRNKTNDYVFPGSGNADFLVEPRKQINKVVAASKIQFTVHDLRRTFITIVESLHISAYALKRLLNHKIKNDVTSGYIVTDVERLRKPMQKINIISSKH